MNHNDSFFNNQFSYCINPICKDLGASFAVATVFQKDRFAAALRTYATWLVRATCRKMASCGPDNSPKNTPQMRPN